MPIRTIDFWSISPLVALLVLGVVLLIRRRHVPAAQLIQLEPGGRQLRARAPVRVRPAFIGVRSVRKVLFWALLFALAIEGTQFALKLAYGFAFRVVDINDVMLNFLGIAVGLLVFVAVRAPYRRLGGGPGRPTSAYLGEVMSSP